MSKDIKLNNIVTMSVEDMTNQLSKIYCGAIANGFGVKNIPSVMLWGPPGVGKSQAVRQIAKSIAEETGKKTSVTDVRLLLFNPIDLRGIPTANADKTLAVWLKPQIFQMDESDEVVNILFLDEISAAPQSVQAAAYQLTLDRVVGEHRLPDNCIIIAAGNRTTDKSVAYKMPKALANRLLHLEIEGNFESWKKWAIEHHIHEYVVGYLSYRRNSFNNFDPASEDLAFATPRSWEMVSNLLYTSESDAYGIEALIAGLVGMETAVEFVTWCSSYGQLPDIDDIFDGKGAIVPTTPDGLHALVAGMTTYASNHKDDMKKIANSLQYAQKLPPDFAVVLLKDYMYIEKDYKAKLMKLPEFTSMIGERGSLLNGVI